MFSPKLNASQRKIGGKNYVIERNKKPLQTAGGSRITARVFRFHLNRGKRKCSQRGAMRAGMHEQRKRLC
jgi:hypothetical protein